MQVEIKYTLDLLDGSPICRIIILMTHKSERMMELNCTRMFSVSLQGYDNT